MESFDDVMVAYNEELSDVEGYRTKQDLRWLYDRLRPQIERLKTERDTALNATYKEIHRLRLKVCTCPWPEDAERTRHLLTCPAWPDPRHIDEGIYDFLLHRIGIGRAIDIDRAHTQGLDTR